MEQRRLSLKELKKRKMLLLLPLLALPFITILFWSLGGGKVDSKSEGIVDKRGFNVDLPAPDFKEDKDLDKMSYYDQAASDSIKLLEERRKDPNYSGQIALDEPMRYLDNEEFEEIGFRKKTGLNTTSFKPKNEERVYQKLKMLQNALSESSLAASKEQDMEEFENYARSNSEAADMKKLEQMMTAMNQPQPPDPELNKLGGMLENILDIQHPSRVEERLKQSAEKGKGKIFAVEKKKEVDIMTMLQETGAARNLDLTANSFYSFDDSPVENGQQNAIEAVIHETQTLVNGSVVKLRLNNDVFISGSIVPKNSFLFGTASLKGERLEVKINSLKYQNSIFPVDLTVYDMDGISGICIPGTINRDVAKASADRSIQTLGLSGLDDSWGAQAAGVGIEAAKSLISKKVKLIKVVVKAGYQVLLYDEKQKNVN